MGGVAARGAAQVRAPGRRPLSVSIAALPSGKRATSGSTMAPSVTQHTRLGRTPRGRRAASQAPTEGASRRGRRRAHRSIGCRDVAPRLVERLGEALTAFDSDRYGEARAVLSKLAVEAPAAAAVRELHGLVLYRMDRWKEASPSSRRFVPSPPPPSRTRCWPTATGHRRYDRADALWEERSGVAVGGADGRGPHRGRRHARRSGQAERRRRPARAPPAKGKVRFQHLRQWSRWPTCTTGPEIHRAPVACSNASPARTLRSPTSSNVRSLGR